MSQITVASSGNSSSNVLTLTGNSGGIVGPTGGNINVVGTGSVTVTGNPGTSTLTIAVTGTTEVIPYVSVNHAASPYTALATDYYISADVTAGVVSIFLPNAPVTGRVYIVKDKVGLAATSNITVTTPGGTVTIDGVTSYAMNTAYQSLQVIFDGTNYQIF